MWKNIILLLPMAAAVLAGALIPIQASSGGMLGKTLGHPIWGAATSLFIGTITLLLNTREETVMKELGVLIYVVATGLGLRAIAQMIWRQCSKGTFGHQAPFARRDIAKCVAIAFVITLPAIYLLSA